MAKKKSKSNGQATVLVTKSPDISGDTPNKYESWDEYLQAVEDGLIAPPKKMNVPKRKEYAFNVDEALDNINLDFNGYTPSKDSIEFFNIIRLVLGEDPEVSNSLMHYFLIDLIFGNIKRENYPYTKEINDRIRINPAKFGIISSRRTAKSTVLTAYLPIYTAITGKMPNFGPVMFMVGFGDSQQSGAKVQANTIRDFCVDSKFCKDYFESMRFTDEECEFIRKGTGKIKDRALMYKVKGASGGSVRGIRYRTARPQIILMDDIIKSEADANSKVIMARLRSMMYADATNALGRRGMLIAVNTPFNKNDPIYAALESGIWTPVCLPLCEHIDLDLKKEDYKASWPQMHSYEDTMERYQDAYYGGTLREFNQELMLRISSEEDRLIKDDMIKSFSRKAMMKVLENYTLVVTTDFTASNKADKRGDYSGIAVWAIGARDDKFLLDLVLRPMKIQEQYEELFRVLNRWSKNGRILDVGVEIDGQQQTNVFALEQMMLDKNFWFRFAKQKGSTELQKGIRSRSAGGNKLMRFKYMMPSFDNGKMWFAEELESSPDMKELREELRYLTDSSIGCVSADTRVYTDRGLISIRDVEIGDTVLAHIGESSANCKVTDAIISGIADTYTVKTDTGSMDLTAEHRVLTLRGYVEVKDLTCNDLVILGDKAWNKSNTVDTNGQKRVLDTTSLQHISKEKDNGYTDMCMSKSVVKYLKNVTYTTKTIINIIIQKIIWKCYQDQLTKLSTQKMNTSTGLSEPQRSSKNYADWLLRQNMEIIPELESKDNLTREINTGYASTVGKSSLLRTPIEMIQNTADMCVNSVLDVSEKIQSMCLWGLKCALNVVTNFNKKCTIKNAVQKSVQKSMKNRRLNKKSELENVNIVEQNSQPGRLTLENSVLESVQQLEQKVTNSSASTVEIALLANVKTANIVQDVVKLARIQSVKKKTHEVVYDISVDRSSNFMVEGGMIIHNSKKDDGIDLISQVNMIDYIIPSNSGNVGVPTRPADSMWSDIFDGEAEEENNSVVF